MGGGGGLKTNKQQQPQNAMLNYVVLGLRLVDLIAMKMSSLVLWVLIKFGFVSRHQ